MAAQGDIAARLVYYGPEGSGKTANLLFIHKKLKKGHRGELSSTQVPGHPPGSYEVLPVELGLLHGFKTSIYVHTVPGGSAHAEVRRRILEQVDGIVFVADLRPARHEATAASLAELRAHLMSHRRSLEDVVFVVQYNHRDQADENAVERLHRMLAAQPAASFEAAATTGTGVLQTLTAVSKFIVQSLRTRAQQPAGTAAAAAPGGTSFRAPAAAAAAPAAAPARAPAPANPAQAPAAARPAPAASVSVSGGKDLHIESVGPTDCSATDVRIPIRLVHASAGRIELTLRLSLARTDES